ncbi:MAG: HmuY family protein [Bacteroidales bacterium]
MFKSNLFKSVLLLSIVSLSASCSKDDDATPTPTPVTLETKTFSNLYAPQTGGQGQPVGGAFTKFSFSQDTTVTDDSWDIAFRGTTIVVNGGTAIGITDEPTRTGSGAVSIVSNTLLSAVTTIPSTSTFKQDSTKTYAIPTGSGNGWYNYNSTNNLITPIPGKVFVVKTHDGKYAKMEIISYYKDAPANPDATALPRYFTFKYVYQPSGTNF